MNWISIGKTAVRVVASISVGQVVQNVVEHTTPETAGKLARVSAKVGGFIIASIVGDHAAEWAVSEVDRMLPKQDSGLLPPDELAESLR